MLAELGWAVKLEGPAAASMWWLCEPSQWFGLYGTWWGGTGGGGVIDEGQSDQNNVLGR